MAGINFDASDVGRKHSDDRQSRFRTPPTFTKPYPSEQRDCQRDVVNDDRGRMLPRPEAKQSAGVMSTNTAKTSLQLLKELSLTDIASRHDLWKNTQNILLHTFDSYCKKESFVPVDKRQEVAQLLIKSSEIFRKGLAEISVTLNAEKRSGAQKCLSALQFLADDFSTDNEQVKSEYDGLMKSDVVEEIEEFVENSKDSPAWGGHYKVDLTNVPKTHFWWAEEEFDQ